MQAHTHKDEDKETQTEHICTHTPVETIGWLIDNRELSGPNVDNHLGHFSSKKGLKRQHVKCEDLLFPVLYLCKLNIFRVSTVCQTNVICSSKSIFSHEFDGADSF